jgi:hypothetical protein
MESFQPIKRLKEEEQKKRRRGGGGGGGEEMKRKRRKEEDDDNNNNNNNDFVIRLFRVRITDILVKETAHNLLRRVALQAIVSYGMLVKLAHFLFRIKQM